ncbi:MAG: hypothetical protein GW763_11060, partial [Paraglaciecola sp.]|nr:hypothetical protein [Paraglaciecola sp.]
MQEIATKTATKLDVAPLTMPKIQGLEGELMVTASTAVVAPEIQQQADSWIDSVLAIEPKNLESQHAASVEMKNLGSSLENELLELSQLLQTPMSELMEDAENGGDVARDLLKLEETARSIDPNGYDFSNISGIRAFL